RGHWIGARRGLAVQLVQQRLEFILADLVAGGGRGRGRGRGLGGQGAGAGCGSAVQLVEQGLELVVGDEVVAAGGRGGGRDRRGLHRSRRGRGGGERELGDQFRRGMLGLGAGGDRVEHGLQPVQRALGGV